MSATQSVNWPVLTIHGTPDPDTLADITALVAAAEEDDGNPPLSEQTLVNLRSSETDTDALLLFATYAPEDKSDPSTAQALAGIAVVSLPRPADQDASAVAELVVHPLYRTEGVGTSLAQALTTSAAVPPLKVWSHGNHEAAVALAAKFGYEPVRELWRMRLTRPAPELQAETLEAQAPSFTLPDGVILRPFVPGQDEEAWLKANAEAFAHHPEQGAMTLADLQARTAEPWFDPAGFLLAVRQDNDALLGFHWTKIHPAGVNARHGKHPAIGEVYVVGVTPAAQGMGLGKALTIAGIEYLHKAGLQAIMLYVDADNEAAVALYRKLGFTIWDVDVMYAPVSGSAG